ncbi:MAG TPA: gephyrin-like molybdotransferase Glp [Candidatus Tectomicrobia bacterium]|nr:gephyrin-like molybdotransferase Glp [Candidatus Tectomicrobia bacterium]
MPIASVVEARRTILDTLRPLPAEVIPYTDTLARVLAQDVTAETPVPPFAQSAMDGFAVCAADTRQATPEAPITLEILGTLGAGHLTSWVMAPGTAVRIMTGAPIPDGADAVIKREDAEFTDRSVTLFSPARPHDHIIPSGRDIPVGTTLLGCGDVVTPWAIGTFASLGMTQIRVHQRPRVGVLALGDELVPPHMPLAPGQIRVSNLYAVAAGVTKYGGLARNLGIAGDRLEAIEGALRRAGEVDLLVTLGGSQRGDFDLVDDLLSGSRGQIIFRDIAANYVRSMIFGRFGRVPLCGLPGAPVASMVAFEVFVRAAIWRLAGRRSLEAVSLTATLAGPLPPTGERTHFQPVWVESRSQGLVATPLHVQKTPALPPITLANGLVCRPPESPACHEGEQVWVEMIESAVAFAPLVHAQG